MSTAEPQTFVDVAEAARILGVSRSTVWRWIKAEKLPAYHIGPKHIRIKRQDLAALVRPARTKEVTMEQECQELFADYDPEKVKEALKRTTGSWADLDTDKLLADLYQAREEGSRPATRP
jgi:excisionase family DNA binding protein